jgi:hypothetical protein
MDVQCACIEDPFILTSNNYVVGEVYWIVLDGCNGNVCDYTVNVLEGSTVGFAPPNPGAISGTNAVCQGITTSYSVALVNGATTYNWTLTPSDAGTLTVDSDSVTVSWSDAFAGLATLCVATSNQCYLSANESCFEIAVSSDVIRLENISFCPGDSVTIAGQVYNQSGTVIDTLPSISGCDTIVTYTLTMLPYQTRSESISLCPGESVTIAGQVYNQSGSVIDTLPSISGCNTIVTYALTMLPYPTRSDSINLCPGESITIGGQVYNQSATVVDTLPALTGCDTIVTYTVSLLPYPTRTESINLCPGESITIGGQVYNQSATVVDTIAATSGCDTIVTYTLTLLPQPTRAETIAFCPSETITLGGTSYTQPGSVVLTLPSITIGCDTIATYTLQFLTPAPSNVSIQCPNNITIIAGSSGAAVNYSAATADSDCTCPGIALDLTSGLTSGSIFPQGLSSVCYTAADSCGQTASCCFNVTVEEDDDEPCDTKVNGCLKYELLTITEDVGKNRTYRIRVTNNCPNKLLYTAFQIPNGMVAMEPVNFSTYSAPSGNTYLVRNPNFTPKYSIRYSSLSDSINNGESDIFEYTLPAQANVTFIHVVSRLLHNIYLEAHLNTFYCPIGVTPTGNRLNGERDEVIDLMISTNSGNELLLFPNPANQIVHVETDGEAGELILQDAIGRVVLRKSVENSSTIFSVEALQQGLYHAVFVGEKTIQRGSLVIQR